MKNKQCSENFCVPFILVAVVVVLAYLVYPGSACKQTIAADNATTTTFSSSNQTLAPTSQAPSITLPEGVEPITFATGTVTIQSQDKLHTIQAEFAETEEQFARGLMYRTSMDENQGMLFIFPWEQDGGFWMYNMIIPLTIAFMDEQGIILEIVDMEPCTSPYAIVCDMDTYHPKREYRYTLEMNKGYFDRNKIKVGDKVQYTRD